MFGIKNIDFPDSFDTSDDVYRFASEHRVSFKDNGSKLVFIDDRQEFATYQQNLLAPRWRRIK